MSLIKLVGFITWMVLIVNEVKAEYDGDSCRLRYSSEKGQCIHIRKCPFVLHKLRRNIFPQLCGYDRREPIVCCPNRSQNIVTRGGLKSQQKCEEYTNYIPENKPQYITAVFGGIQATAKEFPHMALLGFGDKDNIQWKCGGSLISEEFILTAAHCLISHELGPVKFVRLGDLDIQTSKDDAQPQNFKVKTIHRHPSYKPPSHYNDIALIQLDHPAEFTNYVKPACLQTHFDLPIRIPPVATGWGQLSFTGDASDNLMKVALSYFSNEDCKQVYGNISKRRLPNGIDHSSQICAGGFSEAKDTCQGDSGGPLQIKDPSNTKLLYVIGVTSFGKGCGIKNTPGVYTRVSNYVEWIEGIVWPEIKK